MIKYFLILTFLLFSACAHYTPEDQNIISIEQCTPKGENQIPKNCSASFSDKIFTGKFVSLRSKYIGNFVGHVTLEIKTGEKSVMCKTDVTDQNIAFLRALKQGDSVKATGTPTSITRFKNSYHSYVLLENCQFRF